MLTLGHIKRYIELGWIVHPCCPPDHDCQSPGKVPYDPMEQQHMRDWQNHLQFTSEQWTWFLDREPHINLGVLCGSPSSIIMIDIDNEEAEAEYARLCGRRFAKWCFKTGSGLRYTYHNKEPSRSFKINAPPNHYLEVLGDGKQSVIPPSYHPNGSRYRWRHLCTPRDGRCTRAPDWCKTGGSSESDNSQIGSSENWSELIESDLPKGARNETLTRLCGHLAANASVPPAEIYLWLKMYSTVHCKPPLNERELKTIISSVTRRENASEGLIRKVMQEFDVDRSGAEEMILQDPDRYGAI